MLFHSLKPGIHSLLRLQKAALSKNIGLYQSEGQRIFVRVTSYQPTPRMIIVPLSSHTNSGGNRTSFRLIHPISACARLF